MTGEISKLKKIRHDLLHEIQLSLARKDNEATNDLRGQITKLDQKILDLQVEGGQKLFCSFCGKSQLEVSKLIAGPSVFVCDECLALSLDIVLGGEDDEALTEFAAKFAAMLDPESIAKIGGIDAMKAITRQIEFPPEYRNAGLTILNSFSNLISEKYSSHDVKVSIQQEGSKITLVVAGEDGVLERVEETLVTYGLVISGQEPVERLLENQFQIAELRSQLRIAHTQLEAQRDLLALEQRHGEQIISQQLSITAQQQQMLGMLSASLTDQNNMQNALVQLASEANQIGAHNVTAALAVLTESLSNPSRNDNARLSEAVAVLATEQPSMLAKIKDTAETYIAASTAGSSIYLWATNFLSQLPK